MKAMMCAGWVAVLLLAAPMATATTAQVDWSVRGTATNADGSGSYDLAAIPANGAVRLNWTSAVRVTGDNMGLAGYVMDLGIRSLATGTWAPYYPGTVGDPDSLSWCPVYKSIATSGGTIRDTGNAGGPGLDVLPTLGVIDNPSQAFITQTGASILTYAPYVQTKNGYAGAQTWGVGLDSRKDILLVDPNGTYDLEQGYIDLAGWAPGTYSVDPIMKPWWGNNVVAVIASGLSLNSGGPYSGVVRDVPFENQTFGSFEFTIVAPEPATLLLLAAAGLLYRRCPA